MFFSILSFPMWAFTNFYTNFSSSCLMFHFPRLRPVRFISFPENSHSFDSDSVVAFLLLSLGPVTISVCF